MKFFLHFFLLLLASGCVKEATPEPISSFNTYLHISHTRGDEIGEIHERIRESDFSKYKMLWLGGDIDVNVSDSEEIMLKWDSIFNFSSINTLWTVGNHDTGQTSLVRDFTGRETYYTYHKDNFTFLVLDSQKDLSRIVDEQLDLIQAVTDTINESKYLVLLTHKLIWLYNNSELEHLIEEIPNAGLGECHECTNPNNFYEDIYPKLLDVKNKGIEVFCIAGDLGTKAKEFEYETLDGIHFLASGLNFNIAGNKVLEFRMHKTSEELTWEFIDF